MILFLILFFFVCFVFLGFAFRSMIHFFELMFVYGARCDQLLLLFYLHRGIHVSWASQETQVAKNPPADAGDAGLIPGSGRAAGGGNGNTLQYSCLENSMHRGAWRATVHGVAKSQTQLSMCVCLCRHAHARACTHTHTHFQVFQHHLLFHIACGILGLWPGLKSVSPVSEGRVLIIQPPGKSMTHECI